jgi:hypothetical protein
MKLNLALSFGFLLLGLLATIVQFHWIGSSTLYLAGAGFATVNTEIPERRIDDRKRRAIDNLTRWGRSNEWAQKVAAQKIQELLGVER